MLYFRNYDNGWKYPKMIGAVVFASVLIYVIRRDGYMSGWELVLMLAGIAAYIGGKWMNYSRELCSIVGVSSYSQVDFRLEEIREEIYNSLPNQDTQAKFLQVYASLGKDKIKKATYLKNVQFEVNKPQWMS
ncbi:MAG: hypothetical protein NC417_00180 [Candidatus Gastranaerophilales bacterium]|nr:hypothetical protein [Candidatus Gastranaerophilales bacterium]